MQKDPLKTINMQKLANSWGYMLVQPNATDCRSTPRSRAFSWWFRFGFMRIRRIFMPLLHSNRNQPGPFSWIQTVSLSVFWTSGWEWNSRYACLGAWKPHDICMTTVPKAQGNKWALTLSQIRGARRVWVGAIRHHLAMVPPTITWRRHHLILCSFGCKLDPLARMLPLKYKRICTCIMTSPHACKSKTKKKL